MTDLTLSKLKSEETYRANCLKLGIQYVPPDGLITERNKMYDAVKKKDKTIIPMSKESH